MARSQGSRIAQENRARHLLKRLPEIILEYRRLVQTGIKVLVEDRILLAPSEDRSSVSSPVHFKDLGQHVLELVGYPRNLHKIIGSGARFEIITTQIIVRSRLRVWSNTRFPVRAT